MIAAFLARAWGRVWPCIALVLAALAGLFAVRQSGKSAGKQEIRQEIDKANIKAMGDARGARNEIESLDDAAVRDRARQRMRDGRR